MLLLIMWGRSGVHDGILCGAPNLIQKVADRMTTTTPYGHLRWQWEMVFEKGSAHALVAIASFEAGEVGAVELADVVTLVVQWQCRCCCCGC